jgi:transcriptional regulator with XRE-family HTH domain
LYNYQRIKDLREDNDLTQGEVAALLKTTQQQYSKYELGIQEIPVHHLITLADFYKTSTDYLLNRTDNKKVYR